MRKLLLISLLALYGCGKKQDPQPANPNAKLFTGNWIQINNWVEYNGTQTPYPYAIGGFDVTLNVTSDGAAGNTISKTQTDQNTGKSYLDYSGTYTLNDTTVKITKVINNGIWQTQFGGAVVANTTLIPASETWAVSFNGYIMRMDRSGTYLGGLFGTTSYSATFVEMYQRK